MKVIGVLKSKGYNSFGMDQDDVVLAPYTTIMKRVLAVTYLQGNKCFGAYRRHHRRSH